MVEFALLAPILFLLVIGGIDFSRAYLVHNALTNSVREGARRGSVQPLDDSGMKTRALAELSAATASNATVGNFTVSWVPLSPQPAGCAVSETPLKATYQLSQNCYGFVRVRATYTMVPLTPMISNIVGGNFNLSAAAAMAIE
jgi:Flp pilus assembly protein TadG